MPCRRSWVRVPSSACCEGRNVPQINSFRGECGVVQLAFLPACLPRPTFCLHLEAQNRYCGWSVEDPVDWSACSRSRCSSPLTDSNRRPPLHLRQPTHPLRLGTNGRIVEERDYLDTASLFGQLGLASGGHSRADAARPGRERAQGHRPQTTRAGAARARSSSAATAPDKAPPPRLP